MSPRLARLTGMARPPCPGLASLAGSAPGRSPIFPTPIRWRPASLICLVCPTRPGGTPSFRRQTPPR